MSKAIIQRSPPGNRGACLLYATAQFRRVPDSLSIKIDFESVKESIKLGRITSTDDLKALQIIRLGPSLENWNGERILRDIGRNAA